MIDNNSQVKTDRDLANEIAKKHEIDPNLIMAIVTVESAWNPWACRYEPLFASRLAGNIKIHTEVVRLAERNCITVETEYVFQSTSFGLMQIMGASARDLGYLGPLSALFDPQLNLEWGCIKVRQLLDRYPNLEDAIASYNGGSPRRDPVLQRLEPQLQEYVNKVKALL